MTRRLWHAPMRQVSCTFAALGLVCTPDVAPGSLRVAFTAANELKRQDSSPAALVSPVARVGSTISHIMRLLPGDSVSTGTHAGTGPLHPGDEVIVTVEGVGTLRTVVSLVPPASTAARPETHTQGDAP